MPSLPSRLSRLLAIAILVCVVVLGWTGIVHPVLDRWQETQAQIEQTKALLTRYRAINMRREQLEVEVEDLRQQILPKSGVFSGDDPGVVAAELQSAASQMVKAGGGDLLSIQIVRGEDAEKLAEVRVRVQFTAQPEDVTTIFHDLESARPYLFIDNLQIRAGRGARRVRPTRTAASDVDAAMLYVTCDVFGYMRGQTS